MKRFFIMGIIALMCITVLPVQAERQQQTNSNPEFKYSYRYELLKQFDEKPIQQVLEQGISLRFMVNLDNKKWQRPSYSSVWNDEWFKDKKLNERVAEYASHRLFKVPIGASHSSTFYAPLGLPNEEHKATIPRLEMFHSNEGFYVLNARVKEIKRLWEQVVIVAEPTRTGYQEIWIERRKLPSDKMLIHLVTPDGYEIDNLPIAQVEE
ncbi:hypothetical protein [Ammoniphilus sp. 3BR4]|uniref:hypothetical protein n=1 Tax=Ammoniphilus sp. 3BR4 TaxID=3158265 RepID=UPI003465498F